MQLSQQNLKNCFNQAIEEGAEFVGVRFYIEGFPEEEVIINGKRNFESKLNYYLNTYDENLVHKFSKSKVEITGFTYGWMFDDIQSDLVD